MSADLQYGERTTIKLDGLKSDIMGITGYWDGKKEKLKKKFPTITDEDLKYFEGKEREMMEQLSYKLGTTREELAMIIERLI